jgi:hypothetical protein
MVPSGNVTELAIQEIWPELAAGVIVDSGNALVGQRAAAVASAGVRFVDCGVSGGSGLENGYALMFGGDARPRARRALREDPGAGARPRLDALRPQFGPFREDGRQRHRVRRCRRSPSFALMKHKQGFDLDVARSRKRGDTAASSARGSSTSPPNFSSATPSSPTCAGGRRFRRRPLDGAEAVEQGCLRRC